MKYDIHAAQNHPMEGQNHQGCVQKYAQRKCIEANLFSLLGADI